MSTTRDKTAEERGVAIHAEGLGIRYRRYLKKDWTLKDSILNAFRGTKFDSFWALRGASFVVEKGESLGIIGRNGAGKSTLLKAIAGVLPPSEGVLSVDGRVAPLLELGAGFRNELTGRENIFFNGAVMGLSSREVSKRIERIIDFAEIGDFIDAPLHTYSSGMKARLGFSVATEVDAEILLIDEALSVGDEGFKRKAEARTREFFESHRTVILVSHSIEQISQLCSKAMYLRKGELVAEGKTADVVTAYRADLAREQCDQTAEGIK